MWIKSLSLACAMLLSCSACFASDPPSEAEAVAAFNAVADAYRDASDARTHAALGETLAKDAIEAWDLIDPVALAALWETYDEGLQKWHEGKDLHEEAEAKLSEAEGYIPIC